MPRIIPRNDGWFEREKGFPKSNFYQAKQELKSSLNELSGRNMTMSAIEKSFHQIQAHDPFAGSPYISENSIYVLTRGIGFSYLGCITTSQAHGPNQR